jgi:hypothetical protein
MRKELRNMFLCEFTDSYVIRNSCRLGAYQGYAKEKFRLLKQITTKGVTIFIPYIHIRETYRSYFGNSNQTICRPYQKFINFLVPKRQGPTFFLLLRFLNI